MDSKKTIASTLLFTMVAAEGGLCEIANAKTACLCDEDVCKTDYHIHKNTGSSSTSGQETVAFATVTSTSTADLLSFPLLRR